MIDRSIKPEVEPVTRIGARMPLRLQLLFEILPVKIATERISCVLTQEALFAACDRSPIWKLYRTPLAALMTKSISLPLLSPPKVMVGAISSAFIAGFESLAGRQSATGNTQSGGESAGPQVLRGKLHGKLPALVLIPIPESSGLQTLLANSFLSLGILGSAYRASGKVLTHIRCFFDSDNFDWLIHLLRPLRADSDVSTEIGERYNFATPAAWNFYRRATASVFDFFHTRSIRQELILVNNYVGGF